VAIVDLDDPAFERLLRERTSSIVHGRPRTPSDLVFMGARELRDLKRLNEVKKWIEPNGAIWVVFLKGKQATIRDIEVMAAAKAVGLIDNKVVALSSTHTSIRLVIPIALR